MSYQEKNISVSLVNFSLILGFLSFRVFQMVRDGSFTQANVVRLWVIVIALAVFVTIFATILTQIASAILQAILSGGEEPKIQFVEDERDRLIDLRGTRVTYWVASIGVLAAMLTFVFSRPPLVMFTLLIFSGVAAQVVGDLYRLSLYRRGF